MMNASPTSPQVALRVCNQCKRQKRRCDKALPRCSPCATRNHACTYLDVTDDAATLQSRIEVLEGRLRNDSTSEASSGGVILHSRTTPRSTASYPDGFVSHFPPIYFLDAAAFHQTRTTVPNPLLSPPQELLSFLGTTSDVQEVVDLFFKTMHVWFPIIWRRPFSSPLTSSQFGADMVLLYACMKLINKAPVLGPPSRSTLYALAKDFSSYAESSGLLSIRLLQAVILLAVYEIGHGIYPAAYMTVGRAARLGTIMGLHKKGAQRIYDNSTSRGDNEEERRVWYSIIILDR